MLNSLWRPQPGEVKKLKKLKKGITCPKNGHDEEVCANCANKGICENPCAPLKWINGDKPLKEKILNEPIDDYDRPDYNVAIYNLYTKANPSDRIEEIIKIKNYRTRAICAMLTVEIPRQNIAALIGITRQQLYRIITPMLHGENADSLMDAIDYKENGD